MKTYVLSQDLVNKIINYLANTGTYAQTAGLLQELGKELQPQQTPTVVPEVAPAANN